MGGWISSTLVRLGDLTFEFLPPRKRTIDIGSSTTSPVANPDHRNPTPRNPEAAAVTESDVLQVERSDGNTPSSPSTERTPATLNAALLAGLHLDP